MPKRVLIVSTSHSTLGETGYPTGVWLPEVAHPFMTLADAGAEISIATVAGGRPPIDPYSDPTSDVTLTKDDADTCDFLANHSDVLDRAEKLAEVDLSAFDAIIFAGGNGAMFDMASNDGVTAAAETIWSNGGIVASLCHGTVALLNVKADGQLLIKGQSVTGFSNREEAIAEEQIGTKYVPFYLQTALVDQGAAYSEGDPFTPHLTTACGGRLITGQNNLSGELVGQAVAAALDLHSDRGADT